MENDEQVTNEIPEVYSGKKLFEKLQLWKDSKGWTAKEMITKLGWYEQQFYALNREKRTVRAKLLTHVITTLNIDPSFLFSDNDASAYVVVMKNYPPRVLRWLASEEGRLAMMEQYGVAMLEKEKKKIREEALDVYKA